jgi:hypothetical protein
MTDDTISLRNRGYEPVDVDHRNPDADPDHSCPHCGKEFDGHGFWRDLHEATCGDEQ